MKISLSVLVMVLIIWLPGGDVLLAQTARMQMSLEMADRYVTASRTGEALDILYGLRTELTATDTDVTDYFQLQIDLLISKALTKKRDYPSATKELLQLIDAAESKGELGIEARACLGMAYILQRQESPEETVKYLDRAQSIIKNNPGLSPLNAELDNRRAAFERVSGNPDLALKYANRALVNAREHHDSHQLGLAHLLISLLQRNDDPAASEINLTKAARYYQNTGSKIDYLVVTLALTGLQIKQGRMREALISNDSAMIYVSQVQDRDSTYASRVYDQRANIMHAFGRQDSAWHYLRMAGSSRLEHLKRTNAERAVEVEARYNDEKRSLELKEKDRMLTEEQERHRLLMGLMLVGLFSFVVLAYYYDRLRKAKRNLERQYQLEQQNEELTDSLTQQKMLQGEVHHRVKNNLQIIISLLELQIGELEDGTARSSLEAMSGRIYSMAAVHETLYQEGRDGEIDFLKYTDKICRHFELLYGLPDGVEFTFDIGGYWFNLETAIPLGTMLNELLTNSFKYAVRPGRPLTIYIAVTASGKDLCLHYRDNGPGFPSGSLHDRVGGLGSYLLNGMSRQLRGHIESHNENGARSTIYFKRKNDYKNSRTEHLRTKPLLISLN